MFWFILLDSGFKREAAFIFFLSRQDSEGVGQKNQRGQIQPECCSSHYIKEGGYVITVGSY